MRREARNTALLSLISPAPVFSLYESEIKCNIYIHTYISPVGSIDVQSKAKLIQMNSLVSSIREHRNFCYELAMPEHFIRGRWI